MDEEIYKIVATEENGVKLEDVKMCISKTAQKLNLTDQDITKSILDFFRSYIIDLNFIKSQYSEKINDQATFGTAFSEQEYLNKDFRKSVTYKYPIFDDKSFISPKFGRVPYWKVQKYIIQDLPKLEHSHWTNQTLSYARNSVTGKHIIKCIIEPLISKKFLPYPLKVVDATGNIGMDSITFGLEKFVSVVHTYEILESVYDMLNQNVKLYGLDDKIKTYHKRFDYNLDRVKNALVMIDPPYEAGNNSGNFNLSIDNKPIYYVAQDLLDLGARAVILTMPKSYKYNLEFAKEFEQHVLVYQMGKINNKLFLVTSRRLAKKYNLDTFGSFTEIKSDETQKTWNGKPDYYKCTSRLIKPQKLSVVRKEVTPMFTHRYQTSPINISIDPDTKVRILKKIFGNDLVYGRNNSVDIRKTLGKHINTKLEDDKWNFGKSIQTFSKKNAKLIKFLPQNIKSYCDVGCGSGVDMEAMTKKFNIQKSICVDIQDSRLNKNGDFILAADLSKIKKETQQVITLFHTIHHIDSSYLEGSLKTYLKKIYDILEPNGFLLIKDHDVRDAIQASNVDFEHVSYTVSNWKRGLIELLDTYDKIEPMFYYSKGEVLEIAKSIGFTEVWSGEMSNLTYIYGAVLKK